MLYLRSTGAVGSLLTLCSVLSHRTPATFVWSKSAGALERWLVAVRLLSQHRLLGAGSSACNPQAWGESLLFSSHPEGSKGPRVLWAGPVDKVAGIQPECGSVVEHMASMYTALCLILT